MNPVTHGRSFQGERLHGRGAGLGEKQKALDWLERAYQEHDAWLIYLSMEKTMDSLRQEPRFKALIQRLNLWPAVAGKPTFVPVRDYLPA